MRFQSVKGKNIQGPVLAAVSVDEWKKGRWLKTLPPELATRIDKAAGHLSEPLLSGATLHLPAVEKNDAGVLIAILPTDQDPFFLLEFARDSLKMILNSKTPKLTLVLADAKLEQRLADAFGSALAAAVFAMPVYGKRQKKEKTFLLQDVWLQASSKKALTALERGAILGDGTNLARYLATLPPNVLDPAAYAERVKKLCAQHGLKFRMHTNKELKRLGAGAFTAVDQGNPDSAGGIFEITYQPKSVKKGKPVALVGKGVCFDTGGYDVKINGGMATMKGDMQGSSVALACIVTAARLKLNRPMKAYLAVTENHLSPKAYKADEVVVALNGLSIEVVNTDAEGRMVLADTLTLASRETPEIVIDFATLTGAAVRSLGSKIAAGFTNKKKLHGAIVEAGTESGERVWTFPLDPTYFKGLESKVADTLQCTRGSGPDHIYAACFLSKFLEKEVPWVHVDLTPSENEGGLAHVDSMFTGFGVRWLHAFLASAGSFR
ncbi:MAG: leucyl aminopeptidase family protein [Deltaproteobacteria bacterium]|nr:leucyl aminopeptidase family protein [Deltaproteobacteria bacterium]